MDAAELRAMQAPIKDRYKNDADAALITLKAKGTLDDTNIACKVGDRPGAGRRRAASCDRRLRHGTVLRRYAAGSPRGLCRRHVEGCGNRAGYSVEVGKGFG